MFTREVWRYVLPILLVAVILQYFSVYNALPVYALVVVVLFLFRLPSVEIPSCALCLVSPINGKVESIKSEHDPFLKREAQKITLASDIFDAYIMRSVTEGKVMQYWGNFENDTDNARQRKRAVWIQTDEADDVVIVMYSGTYNKVNCYVSTGERVGMGQQCGSTPFGGKFDVYLPANARIHCKVNDKLKAGKDVIAEWVHVQ